MKHEFGGLWTRTKLNLLEKYLQFYTIALKNTPFILHFVDAFAGIGHQDIKTTSEQSELLPHDSLPGSVTIALDVAPPFHVYHFNDVDKERADALRHIASQHPDKTIHIGEVDANSFVGEFCASMQKMDRAVVFLDPYSTELDWQTLERIAATEKADLWLLFPLSTLLRMTPRNGAQIRSEWREKLNRLLDTTEWEDALYEEKAAPVSRDLFDELESDPITERINVEELSAWLVKRLEEVFAYAAEPVLLKNGGRPLFLFLFAVANPSEKAKSLANRVVNQIIKSN